MIKILILIIATLISTIGTLFGQSEVWSLEKCMVYAIDNSYAMNRSANALLTARENYTAAIGRHLPQLSGNVSLATNFGRGINPATNIYSNTTSFQNGYSINASVPIFHGMDSRTYIRKAKITFNQVQSDYNENMRTLRSSIEQTVLDLQGAEQQLASAQKSLASYILANKAARHKWNQGILGIIELQTSNNQLLAARVELLIAQLKYAAKCREVNYYKGISLF